MGVQRSAGCLLCRRAVRGVAQAEMSKLNPGRGASGTRAGVVCFFCTGWGAAPLSGLGWVQALKSAGLAVRRPPGFAQHVSPGDVEAGRVKPGPGGSGWWHPQSPKGIKRGHGGVVAGEEKCLLHGPAAPWHLAASCTAPPEARRRLQEPPAWPRHTGRPQERYVGAESIRMCVYTGSACVLHPGKAEAVSCAAPRFPV